MPPCHDIFVKDYGVVSHCLLQNTDFNYNRIVKIQKKESLLILGKVIPLQVECISHRLRKVDSFFLFIFSPSSGEVEVWWDHRDIVSQIL